MARVDTTRARVADTEMINLTSTDLVRNQYLYTSLVLDFADQIRSGSLKAGEKLPSLRKLAKEVGVSVTTVLTAYEELTALGWIESRPKSGFFVSRTKLTSVNIPGRTSPRGDALQLSISKPAMALLSQVSRTDVAPLGCAVPSAELLDTIKIDRLMNRINRTAQGRLNTYAPALGLPELREQLAKRYADSGDFADPEQIIITNGCTEALSLILQTVARRGDTIALESPTYFGVLQIMEAQGLRVLELPTDHEGISPDDLRTCLDMHSVTACLFSSSYSNPMGATMPDDRKVKILDILAEHKVPLIEDDTYGDLVLRGSRPKPFTAFNSKAEVFYCSSFSKSVAPGYRIGWLRATTRLDEMADRKFATSLCNAVLPQATMAHFIETGAYARHVRNVVPALRNSLVQSRLQIASCFPAGTKISDPAGGFVLWLELPPGFDSEELFRTALEKKICFAPGTIFSATDTYRNCLRISCGHHWDGTISSAILTLGDLAAEQLSEM